MEKIAVIGAGSWGTTLACMLGEKGYNVNLWVFEEDLAKEIEEKRENTQYLPGIKIPASVKVSNDLKEVVLDANLIITAVPSQFLRNVASQFTSFVAENAIVVNVAKGLENETYKRMSQVLEEELPSHVKIVALSGPNHAEEVSKKIPTATVIASKDVGCLKTVKEVLTTPYFKAYPLDDIVGAEICGALKNITALATGVCDGLGFGDNARGAIITLGLSEMGKLVTAFGGKRTTCFGLAGVGDLIATCTSKHSRNRFVGQKLAEGKSFEEIKKEMHGMVAEGIVTTKAVHGFSIKHNLDMPLTNQAYKVLYEQKDLTKAIADLINLI
jgi:glycerol-3-phosphate dehydrogenase (NAD(P)+)